MASRWQITAFLAFVWIVSLLYGELIIFWIPRFRCSWPANFPNGTALGNMYKIALIADPQITDRTSYGMAPGSLALKITQFYSDIYMRRAFRSSVLPLEPDRIIFLGDYFDGGPYLSSSEWDESLKRFKHIFDQSERGSKSGLKTIPVNYLPGNHDIGYLEIESQNSEVIRRYEHEFGKRHYTLKINGVEFIFIDAQSLDGNESESSSFSSWSYISNASTDLQETPRFLLSHIPLYRPDDSPCGQSRASPSINQRIEKTSTYPFRITNQKYLTNATSTRLLNSIKPIMVFSGHGHDQCTFTHPSSVGEIKEYTVGTFSWQQGNRYPSFMLLTVAPSFPERKVSSRETGLLKLCFLPAQDFIYVWYGVLLLITFLILVFWPSQGIDLTALCKQFTAILQTTNVKEKDEDTEWEMIWDAEGGMHLMNKRAKQNIQDETLNEIRGAATLRASAKARAASSVIAEDEIDQALTRGNKGRKNLVFKRICNSLGIMALLFAMNISFYVMLLMKDWT